MSDELKDFLDKHFNIIDKLINKYCILYNGETNTAEPEYKFRCPFLYMLDLHQEIHTKQEIDLNANN